MMVGTIYKAQDSDDVSAQEWDEHHLRLGGDVMSVASIVGNKQDLTPELLGRLNGKNES